MAFFIAAAAAVYKTAMQRRSLKKKKLNLIKHGFLSQSIQITLFRANQHFNKKDYNLF